MRRSYEGGREGGRAGGGRGVGEQEAEVLGRELYGNTGPT